MGIKPANIFAKATGIAMIIVTIAALYLGMRSNFDPSIGPARLDLRVSRRSSSAGLARFGARLLGGIIIGVAQTVGCRDQSRMADPGRACGLPDRAACASARPVPEGGGLEHDQANHPMPFRPGTRASRIISASSH
jgi:hypothetical protein